MRTDIDTIADVLNMHYEGMSENEIRRVLIDRHNYASTGSIYNWVNRFTDIAIREANTWHPKVGDVWIAEETVIRIDRRKGEEEKASNTHAPNCKAKWVIWYVIDFDTRFALASHMTATQGAQDGEVLMNEAVRRAGKSPRTVLTSKLAAYLNGIVLSGGANIKHGKDSLFEIVNDRILLEQFHGTVNFQTKAIRALKNCDTLKKFKDGWLVHYNYFRPNMFLSKGRTPSQAAGISFPFNSWRDVVSSLIVPKAESSPKSA